MGNVKSPTFFTDNQVNSKLLQLGAKLRSNDGLAQDKSKQTAFFATLFRRQTLNWLARHPGKEALLPNYAKHKGEVNKAWDKPDTVKQSDMIRRITITQRKSVHNDA